MGIFGSCGVQQRGSRNWANPVPPLADGSYEPLVLARNPKVYLKFAGSFADSSGNGRDASLGGTGGSFVTSITPNTGIGNTAFDTENTAFLTVPHNASDVARTVPNFSQWQTMRAMSTIDARVNYLLTNFRPIANVTICCQFSPQALPTGGGRSVLFAKTSTASPGASASFAVTHHVNANPGQTISCNEIEAYWEGDGSLHFLIRSFRGHPVRVSTLPGALSVGSNYNMIAQLSYDGVTAWLNGGKFEDGYANVLHVYGLATDLRRVVWRNAYNWTIGKAAWGGQADVIVDEFAIFHSTLSQADAEAIAQVGPTPPLAHSVWGAQTVNRSSFASIQAAVDSVNASGGGTVLLNSGTYNENVILKSRVRLKKNSGTVTLNGRIETPIPTRATLPVGAATISVGDRSFNLPGHGRSVGDVVKIRGAAPAKRHDRRWNNASPESNQPLITDSEPFIVTGVSGDILTFEGIGSAYSYTSAERAAVFAHTPNMWLGLEGITISATAGNIACKFERFVHARVIDCIFNTVDVDCTLWRQDSLYGQMRGCQANLATNIHVGHIVITQGSKHHCVYDCVGRGRDHSFDYGSNDTWGSGLCVEAHRLLHRQPPVIPDVNPAKWGTHGEHTAGVFWNCASEWGGHGACGWRHDSRWIVLGLNGVRSDIHHNDGLGDSCIRQLHAVGRPRDWFGVASGLTGFDRNWLEDITHVLTPSGTGNQVHGHNYGTGADANTFINCDSPHANWVPG